MQAQLQLRESRLISLAGKLEDTRARLKSAQYALTEIRSLIKDQPPKLVLEQAFANEVWWSQVTPEEAVLLAERVKDIAVSTEITNPTYRSLMEKLIEAEIGAETLKPREEDLKADLTRLQKEVDDWDSRVMLVQLEEFSLAEQPRSGLARLM